jgi:hypothetical protein
MFGNKILTKIFGYKTREVTNIGGNFIVRVKMCSLYLTFMKITFRRMRLAEHVAQVRKMRNGYEVVIRFLRRRDY